MNTNSQSARFREHHLKEILTTFDVNRGPFDMFLSNYFRHHPSLGSKDRADIGKKAYQAVRWQALLKIVSPSDLDSFNPKEYLTREDIPLHDRVSFPKVLFDLMEKAYGREKAIEIALNSNEEAPTTLRCNPSKCSRDELIAKLKGHGLEAAPTAVSPFGIVLQKRAQLFQLPEFAEGFFEMQDEGSQLLAELVQAKKGDEVLDYCAGSGGKALAFAHKLEGKGQIYLHDIRAEALANAKKRLNRAGIQNAQALLPDDARKKKILKGRMDWVFVDAPCTGTGTLRRNPDMKWRFSESFLQEQIQLQRQVMQEAVPYLKPSGSIVYATCSILPQENESQVEYFCKTLGLKAVSTPFKCLPTPGQMDGFFAAVFTLEEK